MRYSDTIQALEREKVVNQTSKIMFVASGRRDEERHPNAAPSHVRSGMVPHVNMILGFFLASFGMLPEDSIQVK